MGSHFVILTMLTSSESPKTSSPSVTITLDELARAIDNMGVSAELLYQAMHLLITMHHNLWIQSRQLSVSPNNDESVPIFINVIFRGRAFWRPSWDEPATGSEELCLEQTDPGRYCSY